MTRRRKLMDEDGFMNPLPTKAISLSISKVQSSSSRDFNRWLH